MSQLCQCGCGNPAPIAKRTNPMRHAIRGEPQRYIAGHQPRHCGVRAPRWKGGQTISAGYVLVSTPGHPRGRGRANYVALHVLIAERVLGRPLPLSAEVHHVDEDRANNAHANLVICEDHAFHLLLHRRARALAACGDANALRCHICQSYDRQSEIVSYTGGRHTWHRSCAKQKNRQRADARRGMAV